MAPVIDAVALGIALSAVGWLLRRRRPGAALKRLRRRCRVYLTAYRQNEPRPRRAFVKIVREAVESFGVVKVAYAAGVPITLVFSWLDFEFGHPAEEYLLRTAAVEAILSLTAATLTESAQTRVLIKEAGEAKLLAAGIHKRPGPAPVYGKGRP